MSEPSRTNTAATPTDGSVSPHVVAPGTDQPLGPGETVIFHDRKKRRYMVTLQPGGEWHSHSGMLAHDDVLGRTEGIAVRTSGNMEITILRPTRDEFVLKMKRGAQVIYSKDQMAILEAADVRPGLTVVEAGAGSGALTMALLEAVGPTGRVISYDIREDHLTIAKRNVTHWFGAIPDHWDPRLGDLADDLGDLRAERVILDMLEPWRMVDAASRTLAPGGIVLAYMPTVPQVMRFSETLEEHPQFGRPATNETLVRGWDVDGLAVRPKHRMVAHTAFLTTARRVLARDDGGPPPRHVSASGSATVQWIDPERDEDE